jgi:hypothetical protein
MKLITAEVNHYIKKRLEEESKDCRFDIDYLKKQSEIIGNNNPRLQSDYLKSSDVG